MIARNHLILYLVLLALSTAACAFSFGVGPASMKIRMDRGMQLNQTLVATTDSSEQIECSLNSTGEIAGWIRFFESTVIVEPKSQSQFKANIKVPGDTPNGNYTGGIVVTSYFSRTGRRFTGMGVTPSVIATVLVQVNGTEIRDYGVTKVYMPASVKPGEDIPVLVAVRNRGNIWIKPRIQVMLTNAGQSMLQYFSNETMMRSPSEKTLLFTLPTGELPDGAYRVSVNVSWRDENLWSNATTVMVASGEVAPETVLSGEMVALGLDDVETCSKNSVLITSSFRNTGNVPVNTTLKVIIRGNQTYEETESPGGSVQPEEKADIKLSYSPPAYGSYEVEGYVEYANLKTESKNFSFTINQPPQQPLTESRPYYLLLVLLAAIVLLVAVGFWVYERRRKKKYFT